MANEVESGGGISKLSAKDDLICAEHAAEDNGGKATINWDS